MISYSFSEFHFDDVFAAVRKGRHELPRRPSAVYAYPHAAQPQVFIKDPQAAAAVIAFGINSGAYVAEIMRSGIMSVPEGQLEAGRSLGFTYLQTMRYIILPQAFKNVLPALGNEFIVLLKETSVSGYIALQDLTKGGDIILSRTYDAFFPLVAVAIIYLGMVMIFQHFVKKLERRLQNGH